jgi:phosphoribosylformimino-5-aminoimidazole carboxamide ribotide isomerase
MHLKVIAVANLGEHCLVEVIPVLDVMDGLVVHAVAGRREEYKPLKGSVLSGVPHPYPILSSLKSMGFTSVYIADLDAIMGRGDNSSVVRTAVALNFRVLADVGRRGLSLADSNEVTYVIGTEYVEYPGEVGFLSGRAVSLDMRGDEVTFRNASEKVEKVLELFKAAELKKILVIDLSRVGTESGVNRVVASKLAECFPGKLVVGGGVRDENDVLYLKSLGVAGVLVATAIHKGVIRRPLY